MGVAFFVLTISARFSGLEEWIGESPSFVVNGEPILTGYDPYHFLSVAREWSNETPGEKWYVDPKRNYPEFAGLEDSVTDDWTGYGPSWVAARLNQGFGFDLAHLALWLPVFWGAAFVVPLIVFFWRVGIPLVGVCGAVAGGMAIESLIRLGPGRFDTDSGILFAIACGALASLPILLRPGDWKAGLIAGTAAGGAALFFQWWYGNIALAWALCGLVALLSGIQSLRLVVKSWRGGGVLSIWRPLCFCCCVAFPIPLFMGVPPIGQVLRTVDTFFEVRQQEKPAPDKTAHHERKNPVERSSQADGPSRAVEGSTKTDLDGSKPDDPSLPYGEIVPFERGNIWAILDEAISVSSWDSLVARTFTLEWIVVGSLVGLLLLTFTHPLLLGSWGLMIALGGLSFFEGQRFLIFLTPALGFGFGFLLHLVLSAGLWIRSKRKAEGDDPSLPGPKLLGTWILSLVAGLFFGAMLLWQNGKYLKGTPVIHPKVVGALESFSREMPADGVIFSWWDMGYPIRELADRAVLVDGATQVSDRASLIARSLVVDDRRAPEIVGKALATLGDSTVREIVRRHGVGPGGWAALEAAVLEEAEAGKKIPPIRVFLTSDLFLKLPVIWNFGRMGDPSLPPGVKPLRLLPVAEVDSENQRLILASGAWISLLEGTNSFGDSFRRIVLVKDGEVSAEARFSDSAGETLLVLFRGNTIFSVVMMAESMFQSNLVQWTLLGRIPPDGVKEQGGEFPYWRAFDLE